MSPIVRLWQKFQNTGRVADVPKRLAGRLQRCIKMPRLLQITLKTATGLQQIQRGQLFERMETRIF
ncbi:hypothetical protein DPMN_138034 [Dreissena polymorpha]|uniref:Uncharacterized protein n=1 Tax=Dreissena polymorpha TaxID=45954 RepID=A0A9D4JI77_DREPO|nr:hypothetical protein DPMN_138034 [Dreissena polymorpha]